MADITGFLQRVANLFRKAEPISAKEGETSSAGALAAETLTLWRAADFEVSTKHAQLYDDMDEMEATQEIVDRGLDALADCAVNSMDGSQESFEIVWGENVEERVQETVDQMLDDTKLQRKVYTIARSTLKYGNCYLQPEVRLMDMNITRVMQMPARTMRRNEDANGRLLDAPPEKWAFEQVNQLREVIARFFPWQIVHLRWDRPGEEKYGRPLFSSARATWKKLKAMEEALILNWLTRAFARLLFMVQVPGKWEEKAKTAYMHRFRQGLLTKKIASGGQIEDPLTVVRDIYLTVSHAEAGGRLYPSQDDVKVLDTSNTGFTNLSPLEWLQDKLIMASRVPRVYLGLKESGTTFAKATQEYEDKQFARVLRRVQSLLSEMVVQVVDLQLILHGFNPREVEYSVVWPNPSRTDELERARTQEYEAKADSIWFDLKVIDSEWIARTRLGMDDEEWETLQERMREQVLAAAGVELPVEGEIEEGVLPFHPVLEEGPAKEDEGRLEAYHRATDKYQQELRELYLEWVDDAAQKLSQVKDEVELQYLLDDVILWGLLMLKRKGWEDLLAAYVLGFGSKVVGPRGLEAVRLEMDKNDHFLTNNLFKDVRGKLVGQIMAITLLLKDGRRDEVASLISTTLFSFRGRVGLYAGQYWHAVELGIGERVKEMQRQKGEDIPVRRVLDDMAEHCETCPPKAREYPNWETLEATAGLPADGSDACGPNCRCYIEISIEGQWIAV